MAARSGTVPWFESFDVEAEVADLLAHIERCTGFALPARQRAVFMAIPEENLALMRLSQQVLNDPSFYADAMHSAAAISEDELFMVLSSSLKDMTVQDARAFVSKLWHGTIDDNARKYAEALKRPEREPQPFRPGNTV